MSRINHHPDDATLVAYAAGGLAEGLGLVVAAHATLCPRCRVRVAEAEALGGAMLDALPQESAPAGGLDAVWAAIAQEPAVAREGVPRAPAPPRDIPAVLAPYLPRGLDGVRWRSVAPGIRRHALKGVESGRGTVQLLSIAPGVTIPHHTHGGSELTLVLKGSFADEVGRFRPGDLADLDPSIDHQPVADTAEACICLIATDERLRFSGMMSRMLQPLVGI